ncbi:MAG: N-acetylmuramoyl-L-alanine amidase [Candidatus Carbobacillus altaicus]|nr:N-acetylmuramoyl-L-alanine amidase [Candidatus Carbobacillus altaicus]
MKPKQDEQEKRLNRRYSQDNRDNAGRKTDLRRRKWRRFLRLIRALFATILIIWVIKTLIFSIGDRRQGHNASYDVPSSPQTEANPFTVVLDSGHGGYDVGTEGVSGRYEKDLVLKIALLTRDALMEKSVQAGLDLLVWMTREDDRFISDIDHERAKMVRAHGGDIVISIHANSFVDPRVSGTETYYYDATSLPLAHIMQQALVRATGFNDRGVRQANFYMLKETGMPAVLLELGYVTNEAEETKLWDKTVQKKIAEAIAEGVLEYISRENEEGGEALSP